METTRFGNITIDESNFIYFEEGFLGFPDLRQFVFLDDPSDNIFLWLQSCEKPEVAFPLLEPEFFIQDYTVSLSKKDRMDLQLSLNQKPHYFSIVTIPEELKEMTANLKAPIIVNMKKHLAKQCVLQESEFEIKYPIFYELQQRMVSGSLRHSVKSNEETSSFVVRLNQI